MSPVVQAGLIAAGIYIVVLTHYVRKLIKNPDSI